MKTDGRQADGRASHVSRLNAKRVSLYPLIRPYKKGYLKVTDGYELYYELCGNPKGKPALFLHGGPGTGISPKHRRYFNPKVYNVILFDQRGAGKSRPFASINNNTTWKLVEDIRTLLDFLDIKKVFLFGGSWGSTLALVYAIKYPKTVTGMLLRGIFLCDSGDNEYYFGGGVANLFPEVWERFISFVPKKSRKNPLDYYAKQMKSKNKKISEKYAFEFTRYELSILKLKPEKNIEKSARKNNLYRSLGLIEAHYLNNLCFLSDNYIIKNAQKLSKIPTVIVHGRYDVICRPLVAYRLHKMIRGSKLYFVTAGHSGDKNMQKKLVEEMDRFAKLLKK